MTALALRFREITSEGDPGFEALFEIYAQSLSQRERKGRAELSRMTQRPDYQVHLLETGDLAVGFCILFLPQGEVFALLEYMAVHPDYRSRGWGRQLFDYTLRTENRDLRTRVTLLEVDSDRQASIDQLQRKRRQQFYRSLGCLRIANLAYHLPLPGAEPPPEMDLFVHRTAPGPEIRKAQLEHWLAVIYRDVYSCAEGDPRIAAMLRGVKDPVTLE